MTKSQRLLFALSYPEFDIGSAMERAKEGNFNLTDEERETHKRKWDDRADALHSEWNTGETGSFLAAQSGRFNGIMKANLLQDMHDREREFLVGRVFPEPNYELKPIARTGKLLIEKAYLQWRVRNENISAEAALMRLYQAVLGLNPRQRAAGFAHYDGESERWRLRCALSSKTAARSLAACIVAVASPHPVVRVER